MRRALGLRVVVALLAVGVAATSRATMVRELTLPELVAHADRIVRGRCLDVRETTDAASGLPVSEITFAVAETLKGPEASQLVFRQLGDQRHPGPGPVFVVGEDAVLFLPREGPSGLTAPVGLEQGKIPIVPTGDGVPTVSVPAETPLDPACHGGRHCAVELGRFVERVRGIVSQ
jgi:hypothetical protein